MKEKYPFIDFIWKTPDEKGHVASMQMIVDRVTTPYLFHMEDDWQFFDGVSILTDAIEVLEDDDQIGQVLLNKNYAELPENDIAGGHEKFTANNLRYFIHEHCRTDSERVNFSVKYPGKSHCNYWPHFSLRPSLIRTDIFKHIKFEDIISFEQSFGWKYVNNRYCSAFLQGTRCKHIGRLTSDRLSISKLNAYDLIGQPQFSPLKTFEAYVINLKRRPDRLITFNKKNTFDFPVTVFQATDGKELTSSSRLRALFEHNDYKMRRGIVGCALSHLKLWCQLYKERNVDYYCVFEDDVECSPQFSGSLNRIISLLNGQDIVFLGSFPNPNCPPVNKQQGIININATNSLKHYWGGSFGYIISINGVKGMFDYIDKHTMTNAIDTMMQKAADTIKVANVIPPVCHSHLSPPDSDIQLDFSTDLNDKGDIGPIRIYDENGTPSFDDL